VDGLSGIPKVGFIDVVFFYFFFFPYGLFKVQINNRYGSIVSYTHKEGKKNREKGNEEKKGCK
jgi:hypothetical protein